MSVRRARIWIKGDWGGVIIWPWPPEFQFWVTVEIDDWKMNWYAASCREDL